nr:protein kinase-like domain, concanavalin A-like lectin/glucanase domain protein [Tanacetum cinerariifolium]
YENPIRTLGDYSRPSHKGYRNTIELPDGNNVVDADVVNERINVTNTLGAYFAATNFCGALGWNSHGHSETAQRKHLEPRKDPKGIRGISNFTGRIKGMHISVGNFTYVLDFMIVEDISSIIDPRPSQVVLGKPFVEVSNMTYDLSLGVVKFTNGTNKIAYKMPDKIEQYNSLSDLEKENMKSVYFRNEEDKRRGVKYVMNKILGFYKECLELGPKYLTGLEDE